jgi:hypothetical protein
MRHGAGREREELMTLEAEFGFADGCTGELDAGAAARLGYEHLGSTTPTAHGLHGNGTSGSETASY